MGSPQGRPSAERITRRVERLEELNDSDAVDTACRARQALIIAGANAEREPVEQIRVRSGFFARLDETETGPTWIQRISTPKGAAVKLLLLALFELQVRSPRAAGLHARTELALEGVTYLRDFTRQVMPGWIELAALPTVDSTTVRTHARKAPRNRLRQLKAALDRLAQLGRVELKKPGAHGRYEKFRVFDEAAPNDSLHGFTDYTVPAFRSGRARRTVTTIPAGFFVNGWIDALTDNEIITYLVLRLMAQAFPDRHQESGVFLTADLRSRVFNLDRGFEAHRMLSRYGLITTERDPRRGANGRMRLHEQAGDGALHHFTVNDQALKQNGVRRVITSLERFRDGIDSDTAGFMDMFGIGGPEPVRPSSGGRKVQRSWFE